MQIWLSTLAVAGGGAMGALARIGLTEIVGSSSLPAGVLVVTLAINTAGSLVLGILRGMAQPPVSPALMTGVGVGFLGGFTTWSAVVDQSVALAVTENGITQALGYLLSTLVVGIGAAWWGLSLGARLTPADRSCA